MNLEVFDMLMRDAFIGVKKAEFAMSQAKRSLPASTTTTRSFDVNRSFNVNPLLHLQLIRDPKALFCFGHSINLDRWILGQFHLSASRPANRDRRHSSHIYLPSRGSTIRLL